MSPRPRLLLFGATALGLAGLALAGDPLAAGAGRAGLLALALGVGAWILRRRAPALAARLEIDVAERRHLSREIAVALLEVRGRSFLVGFGPGGVRLLAELTERGEGCP